MNNVIADLAIKFGGAAMALYAASEVWAYVDGVFNAVSGGLVG